MRALRWLGLGVLGLLAGCRSDPSPKPVGTSSPATSASAAVSASSASLVPPPPASNEAPESEAVGDAGHAAPAGGNWLKCYASFQPRTRPDLDVMRLGLMCGPSNGMRKIAEAKSAEIGREGAEREHRFDAKAGECFRIFAVGAPGIQDLDVEVLDPKGKRVAFDTSDDRWPVVKPDGPFCVFDDGGYRAKVRAQRGTGSYAVEIWRLH